MSSIKKEKVLPAPYSMDIEAACHYTGFSRSAIFDFIKSGLIRESEPYRHYDRKSGRRKKFLRRTDLEKLIDRFMIDRPNLEAI